MVERTPELRVYWRQTWTRHGEALTSTVIDDAARRGQPADPVQAGVLARFALESLDLASASADPRGTLAAAFTLLRHGWDTDRP